MMELNNFYIPTIKFHKNKLNKLFYKNNINA